MADKPAHNKEFEKTRKLLDQLLEESKLYSQSNDYQELLDFVVRLRSFAPFNAMLLHIQKPGLSYAASKYDWWNKFERYPKEDARPLIILWPFGPVALVYDVQDTEGKKLPEDAFSFVAKGEMAPETFKGFTNRCQAKGINCTMVDKGDNMAGLIRAVNRAVKNNDRPEYEVKINKNHKTEVKFSTLVHELGHLYLGHLGRDVCLKIPDRHHLPQSRVEIEAESLAYIVCSRNSVKPKSQSYLVNFIKKGDSIDHIDIYQIMRAAGQVENLLGLTHDRTGFAD
ncbi:MAG: ImmA/IrrE family metallo-endopeptidase [Desulfonatronovibrio sp.]